MHLNFLRTPMGTSDFMIPSMQRRILLVDDEAPIRRTLKSILEMSGFEVETAPSAHEAKKRLAASVFHLIITDIRMETEIAGYDVILAARQQAYDPAIAVLSASPVLISFNGKYAVHAVFVKGGDVRGLVKRIYTLLTERDKQMLDRRPAS
jgi:DNA-binding response OmpR family regulator